MRRQALRATSAAPLAVSDSRRREAGGRGSWLSGRASGVMAAAYDLATAGIEQRVFGAHRRHLLAAARGRVLEVGAGTGASLPQYPRDRVAALGLLDPSPGMLRRARRRASALGWQVTTLRGRAEHLPFGDACLDTVVFTLSLCTIGDPTTALREARRVLRPDGRLLVFEHVRASDPGLAAWQDRLTPIWRTMGGGCHPNRDTRASIEAAGFAFESVEEFRERRVPVPIVQPQLIGTARRAERAA